MEPKKESTKNFCEFISKTIIASLNTHLHQSSPEDGSYYFKINLKHDNPGLQFAYVTVDDSSYSEEQLETISKEMKKIYQKSLDTLTQQICELGKCVNLYRQLLRIYNEHLLDVTDRSPALDIGTDSFDINLSHKHQPLSFDSISNITISLPYNNSSKDRTIAIKISSVEECKALEKIFQKIKEW